MCIHTLPGDDKVLVFAVVGCLFFFFVAQSFLSSVW